MMGRVPCAPGRPAFREIEMGERIYQLLIGTIILLFLILRQEQLMEALIMIILFEGVTNQQITYWSKRIQRRKTRRVFRAAYLLVLKFSASRMYRLVIGSLLFCSFFIFPEETWYFPWFMGVMLALSGLFNICPMYMFLRWFGFR